MNAAILLAVILLLWRLAVRINDVSFIDSFWALGMVMLCGLAALQRPPDDARDWLILGLVSLWGLRLGGHLLRRWRRDGIDPRYQKIVGGAMAAKGWSFAKTSLLLVFLTQAPLLFLVCLPAQVAIFDPATVPIGAVAIVGAGLALTGIWFETVGDAQLEAFRRTPSNHGRVLDTGLWRYTRHPNYFGDACTWWGIWLIAAETNFGLYTVPAPMFLTWTLMQWSGAPLLEKGLKKRRPEYQAYIARTSGFFPWPPQK